MNSSASSASIRSSACSRSTTAPGKRGRRATRIGTSSKGSDDMPALWPTQSPSATPRLPDGPNLPGSPSVPPAPLVLSSPNVPTGSWPSPSPPAVRSPPTDWCRNWPRRTRCLDASCPDAFFNLNLFRLPAPLHTCLPACLLPLFCAQIHRPPPTLEKTHRLFSSRDSQPQTHLTPKP